MDNWRNIKDDWAMAERVSKMSKEDFQRCFMKMKAKPQYIEQYQIMNTSFERGANRTDEWYTPRWIVDALGEFDLDPCASQHEFYTAKKCYTKKDDGLVQPWEGRIWLNPPYKNPLVRQFVSKLAEHGNGIALLFNRMDSALWHDVIFPTANAILILRGRLKFITYDGKEGDSAGCGSVLVAWGEYNAECLRTSIINGQYIKL